MKNKKKYGIFIFVLLFVFCFFVKINVAHADGAYNDKGAKTNIELNKSWVIKFNEKLDKSTISDSYIAITDTSGKQIPVDLKLGSDESSIIVTPKERYTYSKDYNVVVKKGIKGISSSNLSKPAMLKFTTKSKEVTNNSKITVCLDAGHGGDDVGNVSVSGIKEKDINLSVVLKAGKILEQNGINVVYTRQSDNVTWSKDGDLKARFDISNNANAEFFVTVHCNYVTNNTTAKGVETYYVDSDTVGQKLAQSIQNGLVKNTGLTDRGIKVGQPQHEILKGTSGNPVMVQLGFISNPQEADLIGTEDFQNKSAEAIANGIINSLSLKNQGTAKISYIPNITSNVVIGNEFTLPTSVNAVLADGTSKKVNVTWSSSTIDTSKEGVFTYKGTVQGYDKTAILTLLVNSKSSPETSKVVCIDPGHGIGKDTGAVGITGVHEDDVTLKVALKVGKILEQHGVTVVYTRTEDERATTPLSVVDSLQRRCDTSNNAKARYLVSIHNNSFDDESVNGIETLYFTGNSEGERLANAIQNNLVNEIGGQSRGLKDGSWLYIAKNSDATTVLTELGFLSNAQEEAKLNSDSYQDKYAEAIAKGILECMGL